MSMLQHNNCENPRVIVTLHIKSTCSFQPLVRSKATKNTAETYRSTAKAEINQSVPVRMQYACPSNRATTGHSICIDRTTINADGTAISNVRLRVTLSKCL